MRLKGFVSCLVFFAAVFFSYNSVSAQIVDKIKDAAGKTKDVTVDTTKKTTVVVTDALEKTADKTADVAGDAAKVGKSSAKKFGSHTVNVTENVAGQTYEGGKWFMVTTWDGTKWVSKRTWFATKKGASKVKDAVVGDDEQP